MSRAAAVTGIGIVSPLGVTRETSWEGFRAGRTGIGPARGYDATEFPVKIAGEVPGDWDAVFDEVCGLPFASRYARFTQMAMVAGHEALAHSGMDLDAVDRRRVGVSLGVGGGTFHYLLPVDQAVRAGGDGLDPVIDHNFVVRYMANAGAAQLSIWKKLEGPAVTVNAACASGGQALELALDWIRSGRCDVVVAGGADATVSRHVIQAYHKAGALTASNERGPAASRPFDRDRDGFVMAEGAALMVLESAEHARARGAEVVCELAGAASTSEAFNIVAPRKDGSGMRRTMEEALRDAGADASEVDWVCAHGTSTQLNDPVESAAIGALLGDRAKAVPVSSIKSMMGHAIGATSAIEAAVTALALRDGVVPPTINLDHPDEACTLDYVPHEARALPIRLALSNAFGFGGHDNTLVFRR